MRLCCISWGGDGAEKTKFCANYWYFWKITRIHFILLVLMNVVRPKKDFAQKVACNVAPATYSVSHYDMITTVAEEDDVSTSLRPFNFF